MTNRSTRRLLALSLFIPIAAAAAYAGSDFWPRAILAAGESRSRPHQPRSIPSVGRHRAGRSNRSPRPLARPPANRPAPTSWNASPNPSPKPTNTSPSWSRSAPTTNERGRKLPEFSWLADSETPELISHNMRLYLSPLARPARLLRRSHRLDRRPHDRTSRRARSRCSSIAPSPTISSSKPTRPTRPSANCSKARKSCRPATRSWPT